MAKRIKLDRTKLLGFRLDAANATPGKIGAKIGGKQGQKTDNKVR